MQSEGEEPSHPVQGLLSEKPGQAVTGIGATITGVAAATESSNSTGPLSASSGTEVAADPSAIDQITAVVSSSPFFTLFVAFLVLLVLSMYFDK